MLPPQPRLPSPFPRPQHLWELAQLFLKLGTIGFGGPPAHIALQNEEVVVQRRWLTSEQFAEGLALCELLPGPASTQLGIYVGYIRAGFWGAIVAGFCFIAPAFLMIVALSWGYFRYQGIPQIEALFLGVSPVVTAMVLTFAWELGYKILYKDQKNLTHRSLSLAIGIAVFTLTLFTDLNIFIQFLGAGCLGIWFFRPPSPHRPVTIVHPWVLLPRTLELATVPGETLTVASLWGWERIGEFWMPLTVFFLKVGSFIFGGGLVIIPLLESEVVGRLHWLTATEFINGVAIGQLTPGPVVLTAAFIGYKVAGILGAAVACIAIFAPSFGFILLAAPMLLHLRQNLWIQSFLRGITPAVLGAIGAASVPLTEAALIQTHGFESAIAGIIGVGAAIALVIYKRPAWQLILLGGLLGLAIRWTNLS
jgi:chromate transporter